VRLRSCFADACAHVCLTDRFGWPVGEGVVATIENGERRSYTIKEGDVFVAPAGAVTYLANTDGRRKLVIAKILHTISVPGKFQVTKL
jgi:hypothetical protein